MIGRRMLLASAAVACSAWIGGCAHVETTARLAAPEIAPPQPPPPPPELFTPVDGRAYVSGQIDEELALRRLSPELARAEPQPSEPAPAKPSQIAQAAVATAAPPATPIRLASAEGPASSPRASLSRPHAAYAKARAVKLAAAVTLAQNVHVVRHAAAANQPARVLSSAVRAPRRGVQLALGRNPSWFALVEGLVRTWFDSATSAAAIPISLPAPLGARHEAPLGVRLGRRPLGPAGSVGFRRSALRRQQFIKSYT